MATGGVASKVRALVTRAPETHGAFAMTQPQLTQIFSAPLRMVGDGADPGSITDDAWQREAFSLNFQVGEVGYVQDLSANTLAQGDLVLEEWKDGKWTASTDLRGQRVLAAFVDVRGSDHDLKRRAGLHLGIAGESWLVGTPAKTPRGVDTGIVWEFLSSEELIMHHGDGEVTRRRDGTGGETLGKNVYIARLWNSDPQFSLRADSPMRRALPIAREVLKLTQLVSAVADSRLNAGLFFVPQEMTFASEDDEETDGDPESMGDDEDPNAGIDKFIKKFIRQLKAPKENPASQASLIPLIMRGPGMIGDHPTKDLMGLISLERNLDTWAMELRQEALHRLAVTLDVPMEVMEGKGGLNHWCVDDQTECLTRDRGWVPHDDLQVGDVVLTLNHETGLSEWQAILDLYRADVVDEMMVAIEGDRHSSVTTPNHRWPTLHRKREFIQHDDGRTGSKILGDERIWTTTDELNTNDSLIVGAPSADRPTDQKWSDDLVELVAWFWTEGHWPETTQHRLGIWQSNAVNPDNVVRIRKALTGVFGPPSETLRHSEPRWKETVREARPGMTEFSMNAACRPILAGLFSDTNRKVIALGFIHDLTASQLELFIDASMRADGTWLPSGTMQLAQSDADRLAPLELAAVLSGRSTNVYPVPNGMTMLSISRKTTFGLKGKTIEPAPYTGTLWCPVTPNRSWFARRNGKTYFTGNTGFNVDGDMIARHVAPKGFLLADFLTVAYLRPMLEVYEGMTATVSSKFRIRYDISALKSALDEATFTRFAYDRREASGIALRRSHGVNEADAPTDEERERREAMELIKAVPILSSVLLPRIFPGLDITPLLQADEADADKVTGSQRWTLPEGRKKDPSSARSLGPGTSKNSGSDMPGPRGRTTMSALVDRLATAADAALERAFERAGTQLSSVACNQKDLTLRDRIKGADKVRATSFVSSAELESLGLSADKLLNGAWDSFSLRARGWVRDYLEAEGIEGLRADDQAALAVSEICTALDLYARSFMHRGLQTGTNGLRCPDELVVTALSTITLVAV